MTQKTTEKKKARTPKSKSRAVGFSSSPTKRRLRFNRIIRQNIQTIVAHREQIIRNRSLQDRISDTITDFSGHMGFVILHVVWFIAWFLLNSGWFGFRPFDPFPYGLLTMIVSLEAIFLSTFVLISQNRMSEQDQQRAELDLQINLLTEHELTRALKMLDQIQDRLGIDNTHDRELAELEKFTKPDDVLLEIEKEEGAHGNAAHGNAAHGSVAHGNAVHGSVARENAPHGNAPHGNAPHGNAPLLEAPEAAPEGEANTDAPEVEVKKRKKPRVYPK